MYCMNCGQKLPESAKFCFNCGISLSAISPKQIKDQETINLDGTRTLVQVKCQNCGAHLSVNSSKKIAHCEHCGSDFFVQDAVKELNVKGNVHVGTATININGSNANRQNNDSEDKLLQKAIEQLELPSPAYANAGNIFNQMCQDYPQNYKGWLGAWLTYVYGGYSSETFNRTEEQLSNALKLCPDETKKQLTVISRMISNKTQCEPYGIQIEIDNVSRIIKENEKRINKQKLSHSNAEESLQKMQAELKKAEHKKETSLTVGIVFIVGGIILGLIISGFIGVAVALIGIAIGIIVIVSGFVGEEEKWKRKVQYETVKTSNSILERYESDLAEQRNKLEQLEKRQGLMSRYFDQLLSILKS